MKKGIVGFDKWAQVLNHLKEKDNENMSRIGFRLDITYAHLTNIVNEFKRLGWIKVIKQSRINLIELTTKGIEYKEKITPILIELKKKRLEK